MTSAFALKLEAVVRDYGNGARVGPIDCEIRSGEFVSLLGPSGCGKTTLLRSIAGFEKIDAGRILVEGQDVSRMQPHRRNIGLVFQSYALFPHLTVAQNVAFGLKLRRKLRGSALQEKVAQALSVVGLSHLAERLPSQLSGGQQQRVAIARSIVLDPPLLLLDEPLSNLDFKLRIQMREELRHLQRRLGTTFVYVTHDQTEALAMSDRIIVLSGGHIAQIGTPAEIYSRPRSRFVADFVGASNLLKVERCAPRGQQIEAFLHGGAMLLCGAEGAPSGTAAWISVRPENIRPVDPAVQPDWTNTFLATVVSRTFCGDRDEAIVRLAPAGGGSEIDSPVTMHLDPGQATQGTLHVRIEPQQAVLVEESAS